MKIELTEAVWLDERQEFSLTELAELSGLSATELRQLMEYEARMPADPHAASLTFKAQHLVTARIANRLRGDFELDAPGLALVLTLLERIRGLEAQLHELQCQLPRHRTT
jgi:chaperone modulatory protein CbpM